MQMIILATAMVVTLGTAVAAAAGILSLMFRLMAKGQLASTEGSSGPNA